MPSTHGWQEPQGSAPDIEAASSVVGVEDSYFSVEDGSALFDPDAARRSYSGLVGRTLRSAVISTGVEFGSVCVAVQAWTANGWPGMPDNLDLPQVPDLSDWNDVVEVPLTCETGRLMVFSPLDVIEPPLPVLSLDGPGSYRLRVHVRGRDHDRRCVAEVGEELFLLQVWPALSATDDVVIRLTDQTGLQFRQSVMDLRRATEAARAASEGGNEAK